MINVLDYDIEVNEFELRLYYCIRFGGGAGGVMIIVVGTGHGDTSSNLNEADCISHSTNTLGKGMNPIILPLAMGI